MVLVLMRQRKHRMSDSQDLEKKAKLRAMRLLERMDRTEAQLRQKLKKDQYPEDVIDAAVQYVESFGYINDGNYARRFVENRQQVKSKREIQAALLQKGVPRDVIQQAMEDSYEDMDESEAIQSLVRKRHFDVETATDAEKKKMQDYLLRKGFRYEDISKVLQVSLWNA